MSAVTVLLLSWPENCWLFPAETLSFWLLSSLELALPAIPRELIRLLVWGMTGPSVTAWDAPEETMAVTARVVAARLRLVLLMPPSTTLPDPQHSGGAVHFT